MNLSPENIVAAICPGLSGDENMSVFIQLATALTSIDFFGGNYNLAIVLRACHMWTLAQRPHGEPGAIVSKAAGKESISFSGKSGTTAMDNDLQQTNYGQQLISLIKGTVPAIAVLGQNDAVDTEDLPIDPYSNAQGMNENVII